MHEIPTKYRYIYTVQKTSKKLVCDLGDIERGEEGEQRNTPAPPTNRNCPPRTLGPGVALVVLTSSERYSAKEPSVSTAGMQTCLSSITSMSALV
jgi:hypothetical protein